MGALVWNETITFPSPFVVEKNKSKIIKSIIEKEENKKKIVERKWKILYIKTLIYNYKYVFTFILTKK